MTSGEEVFATTAFSRKARRKMGQASVSFSTKESMTFFSPAFSN